jgi:TetR/AcrR family transcriptional regulator, fatty acid metabolism regulator protein
MAATKHTLGLRRNLKEQQRRAQIKEAAINLFSSKGYQQSTMDDLAEEAGVSKSLIYWYWENKAALLSELIDTCMNQYIDLLTEAVERDEPFIEKFYKTLWNYLDVFKKSDRLNKLVHFCSLHNSGGGKDNFSQRVNDHYRHVLVLLEKLLGQAVKTGFLPETTDCAAISLLLLSLTEGHIYMSILEDRIPLERIFTSMFLLVLKQEATATIQTATDAGQTAPAGITTL